MKAVESFLKEYTKDIEIEGAVISGSYVSGAPSKRSDIDLSIILSSKYNWRERGSKMVDGFLIEYFVNPPKQIPEYFKEDHSVNRRHAAHMFTSGRIILDKNGVVSGLRDKAAEWMKKPFREMDITGLELGKYGLWDMLDNLRDLYEINSPSFKYTYWSSLKSTFEFYSKFLGHDVIPMQKIHEQLNDEDTQRKYNLEPYSDLVFKGIMNDAVSANSVEEMMKCFERVATHIFEKTGGFKLDGWSFRAPISV